MKGYFRGQTRRYTLLGAAAALVVPVILWVPLLSKEQPFTVAGFVLLLCCIGALAGYAQGVKRAARRLSEVTAKLYRDCDPAAFLAEFEPIAAEVPATSPIFADARTKLSYAHEALGDLDQALADLEDIHPEAMKAQAPQAEALLLNHRVRAQLMREDADAAASTLRRMEALAGEQRGNGLGAQMDACVRLAGTWLRILKGEEADLEPLRQEAEHAKNDIYRAEMELILGRAEANRGDNEAARRHFEAAQRHGHGLYAGRQAAERLSRP